MKHEKPTDLLYRLQFVIGPPISSGLRSWKDYSIGSSFFLKAHPDLNVVQCSQDGAGLTLLGYMLDPAGPDMDDIDILKRLLPENRALPDLIKATFELCGNWILVFENDEKLAIFHDFAGAKSVYYTDVQKTGDLWIASQPRLIAEVLGLEENMRAVEFISRQIKKTDDYWWPGDKTPFAEIKALLPNHYLDFEQAKAVRYWPDAGITELTSQDAIEKISARLQGIMSAAAKRYAVALALSGGLDSRVLLAASKEVRDEICIYNGKRPEMTLHHPDVAIPRRLTKKFRIEYHLIPQTTDVDAEFHEIYQKNAPYPFQQIESGLRAESNYFKLLKVGATGNILETARFYYKIFDPTEHKPDGRFLASLTKMKDEPFAIEAFEDWLKTVESGFNLNIYDLFYLEQRCGRWLSNNCLVFAMAWKEVLFPFNCRQLLIDFLSVSGRYRMPKEYPFYRNLIEHMWPEALREPINPANKTGMIQKISTKIKRLIQ